MKHATKLDRIVSLLSINVENDNDGSNRLHLETIFTKSVTYTESQYEDMEADLNSFEIKGLGFEVYASNDISGYDYWTVRQEEDNYIQITAKIKRGDVDVPALRKALLKAQNHFSKYSRF